MSINRVFCSGRLTHDPELRKTYGGIDVLGFQIAVNDRHQNRDTGEWEDVPNFVGCVIFGRRASGVAPYLHKGDLVVVDGRLRWNQWQDQETGKNRSKLEVVAEGIEFMTRRSGDGQNG